METIVRVYYAHDGRKLHKKVDKILKKFGGIEDKDKDDFYSLANIVFVDVMKRYDGKRDFDGFLYSCLRNKIKTEMTRRNRFKRQADRMSVSIDTPIGEDENVTIGDTIDSGITIEKEFFEERKDTYSESMTKYLSRLSKLQRRILELMAIGFTQDEIIKELNITKKRYADCVATIKAQRNVSVLY